MPALLLRLDRDQECYDVIKYCVTRDYEIYEDEDASETRDKCKNENEIDFVFGVPFITVHGAYLLQKPHRFWRPAASYRHHACAWLRGRVLFFSRCVVIKIFKKREKTKMILDKQKLKIL